MKNKETFSIRQIQDMVVDQESWPEKKTIYATDSEKCLRGVYYSLKGEEPTTPIDPESERRMNTGKMIEEVQIRKLKALGILIEADAGQHRVFNKEYNVSGRLDALIISPEFCSPEAKKLIERKKEIYSVLQKYYSNSYVGLSKFSKGEITEEKFLEGKTQLMKMEHELYEENKRINHELLNPDPRNQLMIVEIKSSNEWGFKYYMKENKPNDSHRKQALFYLSELRKTYPNIIARILYVSVPYQELLEFDVDYDEKELEMLRSQWKKLGECVKTDTLPEAADDVVFNEQTGNWKVNYQAEWCRYHSLCTGDPNWLVKAKNKVTSLNLKSDRGIPGNEKVARKKSKTVQLVVSEENANSKKETKVHSSRRKR